MSPSKNHLNPSPPFLICSYWTAFYKTGMEKENSPLWCSSMKIPRVSTVRNTVSPHKSEASQPQTFPLGFITWPIDKLRMVVKHTSYAPGWLCNIKPQNLWLLPYGNSKLMSLFAQAVHSQTYNIKWQLRCSNVEVIRRNFCYCFILKVFASPIYLRIFGHSDVWVWSCCIAVMSFVKNAVKRSDAYLCV